MNEQLASAGAELDALSARLRELGERLVVAGRRLSSEEPLPEPALTLDLDQARRDLTELRSRLLALAAARGLPEPAAEVPLGLGALRSLLEAISEASGKWAEAERKQNAALLVLERVQRLRHRELVEFEQLLECQGRARDLHLAITEVLLPALHSETEALAAGTHPFAVLLSWIENGENLSDEQWQIANDCITATFGRTLATAIARQRVVVDSDLPAPPSTVGEEPRPPRPTSEVAPNEESAPRTDPGLVRGKDASPAEPTDLPPTQSQEAPTNYLDQGVAAEVLTVSTGPQEAEIAGQENIGREREEQETVRPAPQRTDEHEEAVPAEGREPANAQVQALRDAMWSLIEDDRAGLAFHLARHLEEAFPDQRPVLPSWLARCVALAPHLSVPNGGLTATIQNEFTAFDGAVFERGDGDWNSAMRFLLASAALRPTLIAPATGGATLLRELRFQDGLNSLYQLCKTIASHADRGMPLGPAALKGVRSKAAWEAAADALRREANAWWEQGLRTTMIFAPATKVWRAWLKEGGLIHSLLLPVRNDDVARKNVVTELVGRLNNETDIKREVHDTDRRTLKRKIGYDISAAALSQLVSHARHALGLARRWLELQETSPDLDHRHVQGLVAAVRTSVGEHHARAIEELEGVSSVAASPAVRAAARSCLRAVADVAKLFDPESLIPASEPTPSEVLNQDLLYSPVPLGADLELEADHTVTARAVLELSNRDRFDLGAAFELRAKLRDHQGTALVLEHLCRTPDATALADELRDRRSVLLRECNAALTRDVEQTQKAVEAAVGLGLLRESERVDLVARIDAVRAASESQRFETLHEQLDAVRREIEAKRTAQVAEVQDRLEATKVDQSGRERIQALIDAGDVLTATEYIDLVRSDRPLPEVETQPDVFSRFFPETFKAIEGLLEPQDTRRRAEPAAMVRDLRAMAKGGARSERIQWPVPVSQVRGKQLEQAADMLEAWFTVKRSQRADSDRIKTILLGLGLAPDRVEVDGSGRRTWARVECEPVRDRERCPVTFFGSSARGQYRLLCVWDRPTEEDLITDVGETTHGTPTIVLYFGRMSEKLRRDLAELCRRRRRTFVVVDDVAVVYLCGERGSRLPSMFRCTLPFTFLEPYAATAGLVPPEMFYGRGAERKQIIDLAGSCFIYGGRQLGKTALLRDVEQTFHDPSAGRIGLWLDLKTYGIGVDRPIDELWPRLGQEFKRLGLVPANVPSHASADSILSHVQQWLDQSPERRVLLLLDEADRFLDQDGQRDGKKEDFIQTARLKGLMDRTARRFKVVFAGLHNVQRTTRSENNPLAHYGEPICIGPLLENGEWMEARQLVEEPFASIGYRFESPDLVTRILSQTNYYPSLIQLYCNQLLRHMYERRAEAHGPPFTITSRDVEEAYQSQDLRRAIRDRFTWTLDLDPRYRLIAFCLALNVSEVPENADRGVTVPWIREQALALWPKGFRDVLSEDAFRVLLDEMVGLGVLRVTPSGQYALRSLNVISLLGSKEEIEDELYLFLEREPPPPFEAATFRASFREADGGVDHARRNPLTAGQEAGLRANKNGVSILFGCQASGILELQPFLKLACGEDFLVSVDAVVDINVFLGRLKDLDDRQRNGVTVILVSASSAWSPSWVRGALGRISKLTSKNAFVRVAFVADPRTAWGLVPDLEALEKDWASVVNLSPWHDSTLQQWLDDSGIAGANEADRRRITAVTGNWPALLKAFRDRCRDAPHQWARCLDEMNEEIASKASVGELNVATLFGVTRRDVEQALGDLAEIGEASAEDLAALNSEIPIGVVERLLRWGTLLSFVQPSGGGQFRVDPTLARLLLAARRAGQ